MLTPSYLLHAVEPAEEIAEQLHQDILNRIITRILNRQKRGDDYILTATDKWNMELLQEAGFLLEDIQKDIIAATKLMQSELVEAVEDAGVRALEYDDKIYREAGFDPAPLVQSPRLIRIMQRDFEATLGEWENFTRTTATASQQTFIRACDKAYHQSLTGAISQAQAIKEALEEVINSGVYIRYPTGHTDTIETATTRAVRTGISQASADIQNARMDDYDVDLVLVSSHFGARPEHAEWQGKIYSRSGTSDKYPDFISSTGYGTVTGLCGANCRHNYGPWFEGMDNPFEEYDTEENRKAYELQQRQRALERRIRDTKRKTMNWKTAMDAETDPVQKAIFEAEYQRKAALLQKQNATYKQFCEENDFKTRADRISIAKWDRKQAAAARGAAKKYQNALEKQANFDKMVEELHEKELIPKHCQVHIPPQEVFVKGLSFDDKHINQERHHNVSREMAELYIQQSRISITLWRGQYERYYSTNGAAYVNWMTNSIRTAFSGLEFSDDTLALLEVLEKYGY